MLKHGKWTLAIMATGLALGLAVAGTSLAEKGGNGGGKPGGGDPPPDLPTYSIEMLGTLGASSNDFSVARGMNNLGDVVGVSSTNLRTRAFLYTDEFGMEDLNRLINPNAWRLQTPKGLVWGPDFSGDQVSDLYVASAHSDEVLAYDGITGEPLGAFVSAGDGGLDHPHGLLFRANGNLLVCSRATDQVLEYDTGGNSLAYPFVTAGSLGLDDPVNLTFGPDENNDGIEDLYVTSRNTHEILVYSGDDGSSLRAFVTARSGGLDWPHGLAFHNGDLYVVGLGSHNVIRYTGTTGEFVEVFAEDGLGNPGDPGPVAMIFGPQGDLYVAVGPADNVLRYDGDTGEFIDVFVAAQSGGLTYSVGLLFDTANNNLLVSSRNTDQILVYQGPAGANPRAFIDSFVLNPDWFLEDAHDINLSGQIVGYGYFKGKFRAFRLTLGNEPTSHVIDNLGTLGGDSSGSSANGINDAGDVTGSSGSADGVTHAFVFLNDGQMVEIAGLSDGNSYGNSINESAQITGGSGEGAFRYTLGVGVELLASKKKVMNVGAHINDSGQVAGQIDPGRRWSHHAARFTDGVGVEDLGTLGGEGTDDAGGINNSGDVVGWSTTAEPTRHAFLYTDATGMIDLEVAVDPPAGYQYFGMLRPKKINDPGQICGSTSNEYGLPVRAFLLTPQ